MPQELQIIRSQKHKGHIFLKIKNSKDRFICKFYPSPNGKENLDDVKKFMSFWNDTNKGIRNVPNDKENEK